MGCTHLDEKVARVPFQIECHMQHREVALAACRGEVAMHHADKVELVEGHAGHKGDRIIVVLPLVHQLLIGVAICKRKKVSKKGKGGQGGVPTAANDEWTGLSIHGKVLELHGAGGLDG